MKVLVIINDAPYGTEKAYNALRLASQIQRDWENSEVCIFLMADAVTCAIPDQNTPNGYYNIERMLKSVVNKNGKIKLCTTCAEARGLKDIKFIDGAELSTMKELAQLTSSGFLNTRKNGRQVNYLANEQHPLFPELKSMVAKVMGIDQVIDGIVIRLGELKRAYLIDDYAEGKDTGIVDLLLVGSINMTQLADLSQKTEKYIKRKIRSLVVSSREFERFEEKLQQRPHLLIWEAKK